MQWPNIHGNRTWKHHSGLLTQFPWSTLQYVSLSKKSILIFLIHKARDVEETTSELAKDVILVCLSLSVLTDDLALNICCLCSTQSIISHPNCTTICTPFSKKCRSICHNLQSLNAVLRFQNVPDWSWEYLSPLKLRGANNSEQWRVCLNYQNHPWLTVPIVSHRKNIQRFDFG